MEGNTIAQLGIAGAALASMLSLFFWAFKRLFKHVLDSQIDFKAFMSESVKALSANTEITKDVVKTMERMTARMDSLENEVRKKVHSRSA